MAWNFDPSLSTDKDFVRFLIGDTNTRAQMVQDETIEAILTEEANKYMAASQIVLHLARGLGAGGTIEDRKVGETRVRYRSAKELRLLAADLRMRGAVHMKPSAGGVYSAETAAYNANTTLDKTEIAKRMTDNPRAGSAQSLTNATT